MSSKKNRAIFDEGQNPEGYSRQETIGLSEQRRPLVITHLGDVNESANPFKIFIIAGQHGDERCGRKAASRLAKSLGISFEKELPSANLAVLTDANPDGSYRRTRTNSTHVDMNRDHQRLDSQEVRTIHQFVRTWQPHIVIDVHNYPSRRKHLLARGLAYYPDIFIDVPTNPAIRSLEDDKIEDLFITIQSDLGARNFASSRYTIVTPSGRVRHSTWDITNARNFLPLRYDAFTILVEGKNPTRQEERGGRKRAISAQYHALYSLLRWASKHRQYFTDQRSGPPPANDRIPIRFKYQLAKHALKMDFMDIEKKKPTAIVLDKYTPELKVTGRVALPYAYAVPSDKTKVIEILQRHGFTSEPSAGTRHLVEFYTVESYKPSNHEDRTHRKIRISSGSEVRTLEGYALFATNRLGGHCLALFLEPQSKVGLHRYNDLGLQILENSEYQILRVLNASLQDLTR